MSTNNKIFKICVSSTGETLEAEIDSRFGRCQYFIIIDIDNNKISNIVPVKNVSADHEKGAGIGAVEQIAKLGVNLLITGEVGPKADEVLKQLEIKVCKKSGNARVAISEYLEEKELLKNQRIFIPLMDNNGENSLISLHFGHAPYFGLYDTEFKRLTIKENKLDHGNLDKTPVDQVIEQVNPTVVYARDMGSRAVNLFTEKNIILKTGIYKTAKEVIDNITGLDDLAKSCSH